MARIQSAESLGEVLPQAVPVNSDVPRYDEGAATANARATASNAKALRGVAGEIASFGAAIAKREEDDENYEIEKRFIDFDLQQDLALEDAKRRSEGDPKEFTGQYMAGYSEQAKNFFKEVPDRLKPKVDQMLTQRAAKYEEDAWKFEQKKRDDFFTEDLNKTLTEYRGLTQKAPDKFKDNIARGVSLIDASRLSGDAKAKLKKEYAQATEEDAIRARVAAGEDPVRILKDIDALPSSVARYNSNGARTSEAGLQSIRDHESFFGTAYRDGPGGYSVGYGTYGVKPGTKVTREEAEEMMLNEVRSIEADIARKVTVPINQNQHDAMVDFFYNLGTGKGRLDKVAEMINEGRANEVPNYMRQFTKARDAKTLRLEELDGLVTRRENNARKFAEPSDEMVDMAAAPIENKPLEGVLEPANVDFLRQPTIKNADGSVSTIRSFSIERDGKEILLPSVTPDGRSFDINTEAGKNAAIAEYDKTGKHLGIYSGVDAATAAAERFHESEERRVADQSVVYRHLSSEQRTTMKNIVTVAGREAMQQAIDDDADRIRDGGLEAAKPDENGKFAIEKAKDILTPNQYESARQKLREAALEHRATSPLENMTEDQALAHLEQFMPDAEADDESYSSARRVEAKAERKWKEIQDRRTRDPALAVRQSPEVRGVFDAIKESADADGNPTIPAQKANVMLIEARLEAQKRLGIRDRKVITRKQALDFLDMPDPSTMSEKEFRTRLKEAMPRAIEQYGDKYGPKVFEDAVGYVVGNQKERDVAAPFIRRMAKGEPISPADIKKSQDIRATQEADKLFPAPTDAPLTNRPTTSRSEAQKQENWPKPTNDAIKLLKRNRESEKFDMIYGPGAASRVLGSKDDKTTDKKKDG